MPAPRHTELQTSGVSSGYRHRIAIANSRLIAFNGTRVTFKWKDYRAKADPRYTALAEGRRRQCGIGLGLARQWGIATGV